MANGLQIPEQILLIAERLRTQDNRITSHPIFMVQERKRISGIDAQFDPPHVWITEDREYEADAAQSAAFDALYEQTGEDVMEDGDGVKYDRIGYQDEWLNVTPCFTQAAADAFIKRQGHNYRELRVYVASGYDNPEWRTVRDWLMSLTPATNGGNDWLMSEGAGRDA